MTDHGVDMVNGETPSWDLVGDPDMSSAYKRPGRMKYSLRGEAAPGTDVDILGAKMRLPEADGVVGYRLYSAWFESYSDQDLARMALVNGAAVPGLRGTLPIFSR